MDYHPKEYLYQLLRGYVSQMEQIQRNVEPKLERLERLNEKRGAIEAELARREREEKKESLIIKPGDE